MTHDLAFDLVELVPCPAPARDGPGAALREVAFREDAWLPGDIDGLQQRFAADEDLQGIADALDRTLAAVRSKVQDLGLRRNSTLPWPGMDDAYLAEHYGHEATSTIAATLGRSCGAVYARAGLLGLTEGNPPYSDWEVAQVRAGYAQGLPVAQLGVLVGRPASGIAAVAARLGIRHANAPRTWSGDEEHRALELADTGLRYAVIAKQMHAEGFPRRSAIAVGQTLRGLGYGRGWGRPWLPEEDDWVRDAYAHGKSLTPLRTRLGRNRASIAHRAGELKLQGTHVRPNGWRTEPSWTAEDIAVLRRDYGRVPTPELAQRFNRPKAGVYAKAWSLRLQHGFMQAFSGDEERAIRIARDHGISLTDLSAALDRDPAVVSKHAIRMGVPFSTRTRRAPRGPRRNRPPVTLEMLLAMGDADHPPAQGASVANAAAEAVRQPGAARTRGGRFRS